MTQPTPIRSINSLSEVAAELEKLNRSQDMIYTALDQLSIRIDGVLNALRATGTESLSTFEVKQMTKRLAELEQRVAQLEAT